ncbi:MAG: DUF2937 family protein [Devosia sp.]
MRRTLSLVAGVALGLGFSQFPEFAQQYEQRLGGAVDELRTIVADFDSDAQRFGLTRQQALARYAISSDGFLVGRGLSMDRTLARYDRLSQSLADLGNAGPLERVAHLRDYFDGDVAARAWEAFKPAVPVTPEGIAWGLSGVVVGYLGVYPLLGLLTLPLRWRRGKSPHKKVPLALGRRRTPEPAAPPLARPPRATTLVETVVVEPVVVEPVLVAPAPGPRRNASQREIDERIVRQI